MKHPEPELLDLLVLESPVLRVCLVMHLEQAQQVLLALGSLGLLVLGSPGPQETLQRA